MYWAISSLWNGRDSLISANLAQFRIAFGLSLLWKFLVETRRGYPNYYQPHTYLYARERVLNKGKRIVPPFLWKVLAYVRLPAAACVVAGWQARPALLICLLWFALEMKVYFKYHANFFFLCGIGLLFGRNWDHALSLSRWVDLRNFSLWMADGVRNESIFPFVWIMLTTTAMYVFSAIHKMNPRFLSGEIVSRTLHTIRLNSRDRKGFDFYLPESIMKALVFPNGAPTKFLSVGMWGVLVVEALVLPIGLNTPLFPKTSILIGATLHGAFFLLFPATLLHFSLISVGTYLVFFAA